MVYMLTVYNLLKNNQLCCHAANGTHLDIKAILVVCMCLCCAKPSFRNMFGAMVREKWDGRDKFILETSVSAGSHTKVTIRSSILILVDRVKIVLYHEEK